MKRVIVILAILAVLSAVLIHKLHERLYGLPIPEGLNPNSTFALRIVGFTLHFSRDLCDFGSRWGLVDNPFICWRNVLSSGARLSLGGTFTDMLEVNDTEIFGTKVRIYTPINKTKIKDETTDEDEDKLLPAVIYYHGGGWTLGSLDIYDAYCRRLAATAQVIVVSTDYRQAPEYLYPTAFHDCYNVAVGLLNNGSKYGVDVKKIMLAGDSAGGNLAAAVSQYLAYVGEKHCRKQYLAGQILIYPSLQFLSTSLPSHKRNEDSACLSTQLMAEFISLYLTGNLKLVDEIRAGNHSKHLENTTYMSYINTPSDDSINNEEKTDDEEPQEVTEKPTVKMSDLAAEALHHFKGSPLMATNFRGIPPTLIVSAEYDPLRDEAFLYAKRLKDGGVDVLHKHYNSFHGFAVATSEPYFGTQEGFESLEDVLAYIRRMKDMKTEPVEEEEEEHQDS